MLTKQELVPVLGTGVVTWWVLFRLAQCAVRRIVTNAPEATPQTRNSMKPNTIQGFAFLFISTIHSTLVTVLSWSVVLAVVSIGSTEAEVDKPLLDQLRVGTVKGSALIRGSTSGAIYLSWVLFEVIFFSYYWRTFGKVVDMIHHILFLFTGLFCWASADFCAYYGAVLMSMETSTPFLNLYLAFRNSERAHWRKFGQVKKYSMHGSMGSIVVGVRLKNYNSYYVICTL